MTTGGGPNCARRTALGTGGYPGLDAVRTLDAHRVRAVVRGKGKASVGKFAAVVVRNRRPAPIFPR